MTFSRSLRAVIVAYAFLWLALAINPVDRTTWLLENLLVMTGLLALWALARITPFSNASLLCIFIFFSLHTVGAAFLGAQGDEWDAHRDMALAGLGALLATGLLLCLSRRRHRGQQLSVINR